MVILFQLHVWRTVALKFLSQDILFFRTENVTCKFCQEDQRYCRSVRLLKPRLIHVANIKEVQQRLYVSIKMGIFDKSNYIVNTGIIEQVFQCTAKVILLAKMIKLSTFYENVCI